MTFDFQLTNSISQELKYQIFAPLDCKDIGIVKQIVYSEISFARTTILSKNFFPICRDPRMQEKSLNKFLPVLFFISEFLFLFEFFFWLNYSIIFTSILSAHFSNPIISEETINLRNEPNPYPGNLYKQEMHPTNKY